MGGGKRLPNPDLVLVVQLLMPRLGKKTLYLDLDALAKMQAALALLPGKPSLSSYLNELLPMQADMLEKSVIAAREGGLRGLAQMFQDFGDVALELHKETRAVLDEPEHIPPKEKVLDVPVSKPKRQKKSA